MDKTAYRILIAHTGENLAAQDINEILKYAWDGQISKDVKITSNPLTPKCWSSNEEFAIAWTMWLQMLRYSYHEHPFWEDHKTHAYKGTIVRTGQRFYTEIYYKSNQNEASKKSNTQSDQDTFPLGSELCYAAFTGNLNRVKELLASGTDPNTKNPYGNVPIHFAARSGYLEIVKCLIEHGAVYDSHNKGMSPMEAAACNGNINILKYLIEEKAVPVNQLFYSGTTPLFEAALMLKDDAVMYLLSKGADPNVVNDRGETIYTMMDEIMKMDGVTAKEMQDYKRIINILRKG
jgi:hypothetical protein